jgi:hypothetical protein
MYCIDNSVVQISQVIDFGPICDVFYVSPQNKIKGYQIGWSRGPWNGATWTNPYSCELPIEEFVDKYAEMWLCHQVPVAQCSCVVCRDTQHLSLFMWRKNGPITSLLVIWHHKFNFALSHSYTLTSWGFWDRHMWELGLLALPKIGKVASSLKHPLLR